MLAKITFVLLVITDMDRESDPAGSWCAAGQRGDSEGKRSGNEGKRGGSAGKRGGNEGQRGGSEGKMGDCEGKRGGSEGQRGGNEGKMGDCEGKGSWQLEKRGTSEGKVNWQSHKAIVKNVKHVLLLGQHVLRCCCPFTMASVFWPKMVPMVTGQSSASANKVRMKI